MLDGQGLQSEQQGCAGGVRGRVDDGGRRPLHRVEGDHRRLLALGGQLLGGGGRVGEAVPDRPAVRRCARCWRCGRSSSAEDFGSRVHRRSCADQDARLAEEIRARHGATEPLGQLRSGGPVRDIRRTIEAVWRMDGPRLDRHARSAGPRCRAGRGAGPGRVRAGPGAVAGARCPGQPRRLADRDRRAQGDRRIRRERARDAKYAQMAAESDPAAGRPSAGSRGGRADRGRCARLDLRRLPSGAAAASPGWH